MTPLRGRVSGSISNGVKAVRVEEMETRNESEAEGASGTVAKTNMNNE